MSTKPSLVIHHLHYGQSERVPWLCEELSIPYTLVAYTRNPFISPPALQALHPIGAAPVIEDLSPPASPDQPLKMAESGACLEYIAHAHGGGRLFLPPAHPDYARFLYWWHFGNNTLQPSALAVLIVADERREHARARLGRCLRLLDDRLAEGTGPWLAGDEFTAADVMAVFSLTTMRYFVPFGLEEYPNIVRYLGRIGEREAYRTTMERIDPGMELLLGAERPKKTFFDMVREKGRN